jgi:hypothetical protein
VGQREDVLTAAYLVLDAHGQHADAYLARKIEDAEAQRDGKLVTSWLLVREAVREMTRQSAD